MIVTHGLCIDVSDDQNGSISMYGLGLSMASILTAIRDLTVQARSISFAVQQRQITLHPQARNISFTVEDL